MIDLGFVEKLLELLNRSNAHSIEVRRWWTTVKISKGDVAAAAPSPTPSIPSIPSIPSVPSTPSPAPPAEAPAEAPKPNLTEIKSPMVGTFYAQPEPGADPYVRVGSRITVGQTLCIIEAMKIMNPLDAELAGVVREIAVQDAQPVEFGQVLFRVDPNG
jgi:acetyl-CoA carboxylase biotin carboxyl carrier protein